jgi:TonB family protein
MRLRNIAVFLVPMLLAMLSQPLLAVADDSIEQQLRSLYLEKVLTLRHFYRGEHLAFQSDGTLVGAAEVGPWTVDGQIQVKDIKLHEHTLQIRGRRVCLLFDSGTTYRDALVWLSDPQIKDHEKLEETFRKKEVEIEIELGSDSPDVKGVVAAIDAVFLTPTESIGDFVPEYWRLCFSQIDGRQRWMKHTFWPANIVKVGNGVSPPRVIHQQDPKFSEEARQAKYQGTMTLLLVVDSLGDVKDLEIASPLGLGLDEQAMTAVSTWKFQPGMKDGQPVPIQLVIEVDFHLY